CTRRSPQQRLVPDTSLSRGDLRVHAEAVRIDGTLEARLRGALDAVIRQTGAGA
ncbi:FliH/SctL family protein, partial [Stenotrophomonas maltophilia]|uniref:FliH/SctL family protein n=1 Tax=Stenotrophomonas maltophilia TaxID=40324 RepID=UPI001C65DDF1